MAGRQARQNPLEVLPAMLNLVLIQTGKILRDPGFHDPKSVDLIRRRINEFVPLANDEFQNALDEIEAEILQAKAVLERDLSLIRRKRVEKSQFANPLKPDDLVDKAPKPTNEVTGRFSNTDVSNQNPKDQAPQTEDVPMVDVGSAPQLQGSINPSFAAAPVNVEQEEAITAVQDMPQDSENSAGLAITMPAESKTENHEPLCDPDEQSEATIMPTNGTAPVRKSLENDQANDIDFKSMFNDMDFSTTDEPMEFDFSTDHSVDPQFLGENAFGNVAINNIDLVNTSSTTNEDLNTLLPGLENFVNEGDDISNLNIPVSTQPNARVAAESVGTSGKAPAEPTPAEQATDDFFGLGDFAMGGDGDDEMGANGDLGGFEDFDDEWFNTDPK